MLSLYSFFLSLAFAQGATEAPKPSLLENLFPFFMMFVVFYFLILRPQAKQRKEHAKLLTELKKGDEVITGAGIFGRIEGLNDKFVTLQVDEGVKIKILRSQILGLAKDDRKEGVTNA